MKMTNLLGAAAISVALAAPAIAHDKAGNGTVESHAKMAAEHAKMAKAAKGAAKADHLKKAAEHYRMAADSADKAAAEAK